MGHVFLLVSVFFKESLSLQAFLFPLRNYRQYHPLPNPTTLKRQSTALGGWNERSRDDQAGEKLPRKESLFVHLESSLIPPSTRGRANTQIFHETRL